MRGRQAPEGRGESWIQGSALLSLQQALVDQLGPSRVWTQKEVLQQFAGDALSAFRAFHALPLLSAEPQVVVRPQSTEEVVEVIRLARERQVPIVPYGGGTGVMGGVIPVKGGIVMDLKGLNRILEIRPQDRSVVVEAGVILEDLEKALNQQGLMLGHDPWSLPIATVGGAISTDGVGYRSAKYGSMGAQVLGLQVALPSGQLLETRGVVKATGPSLNHLFIGAEGIFGVITRAVLRVYALPEKRRLHAVAFPSFEDGFQAVVEMHNIGLRPALADYSESYYSQGPPEIVLYLGFEGYREEVEAQEDRALRICRRWKGRELESREAQEFWDCRHETGERYRNHILNRPYPQRKELLSHPMDYIHVALPLSRVLEYRRQCREIAARYQLQVREWSIWGFPEFFSFLVFSKDETGDQAREDMARGVDQALRLAQDMAGAMEYCHGVGIKLAHLMSRELGVGLEVLREIKKGLDPFNIMNPGKLGL